MVPETHIMKRKGSGCPWRQNNLDVLGFLSSIITMKYYDVLCHKLALGVGMFLSSGSQLWYQSSEGIEAPVSG